MTNEEWLITHEIEDKGVQKLWLDAYNRPGKVLKEIKYHGQDYYSGERFLSYAGLLWRKGLVHREYRDINGESVMTFFLNQLPNKLMKELLPIHIPTNEDALRTSIPFWNPNTCSTRTEDLWTVVPHDKKKAAIFNPVDDAVDSLEGAGYERFTIGDGYFYLVKRYDFGYGIGLGIRIEFLFTPDEDLYKVNTVPYGDFWNYKGELPARVMRSLTAFKNRVIEDIPLLRWKEKSRFTNNIPGNTYFDKEGFLYIRKQLNNYEGSVDETIDKGLFFGKSELWTVIWIIRKTGIRGEKMILDLTMAYDIAAPKKMSQMISFADCIKPKYVLNYLNFDLYKPDAISGLEFPTAQEAWAKIKELI